MEPILAPVATKTGPHSIDQPPFSVFAYAAQSFYHSVSRAAGVAPILSPPITASTFNHSWLRGQDLIYLKLHGYPRDPTWYGDDHTPALNISSIDNANLDRCTIFAANCHLTRSPFLAALFFAGAHYVIGGDSTNYAAVSDVAGADLLGLWLRRLMSWGIPVPLAFRFARWRVLFEPGPAAADTAKFHLFDRNRY